MRRRQLISAIAAATMSAALSIAGRSQAHDCGVPPDLQEVSVKLPHLADRLRDKQAVEIVAIGGASTLGTAAGGPEFAYPQRMRAALGALYPDVPVTVANKGVARQSAQQMVERFSSDVLAEKPVLVVWEVGTVDAVRGHDIDDFETALQSGIDKVKNQAIDIVLMDMQFSRRTMAVINFERYLEALHRIGEANEIYVFPRFAMMRYWSEQNLFNFDEVAESERAKLAASVYDCIGRHLAEAIRSAAR